MGFQIKTTYSNKDGQLSTAFPFFIKSWGIIALLPFIQLTASICALKNSSTCQNTYKRTQQVKYFVSYLI
jgi:hypothetical protein